MLALRRDLRSCVIDGVMYCVMVGIAELYIPAFVEALGLGPVSVGLIATVPLLIGALAQLKAPAILRRMGSYTRFVSLCAYVQAALYAPLAIISLTAHHTLPYLRAHDAQWVMTASVFTIASLYWTAALFCGPAWISLTGAIIPARIRANYFARRLRWLQFAQLLAILGHGVVLTMIAGEPSTRSRELVAGVMNPAVAGFAVVFLIGLVMRTGSAWYLSRYSEPRQSPESEKTVRLADFVTRIRHRHDGRYVLFLGAANAASLIANPFFNAYMLDILQLKFRPLEASVSGLGSAYPYFLAAAFLGRVLAVGHVGGYVRLHGAYRTLLVGTTLVIPIPLLWLITDSLPLLLLFQVLGGIASSTFEYSAFMMYYEAVKPSERTSMLTQFQLLNESCKTSGSLLGAGLLRYYGKDQGAYAVVFWASTVARILVLPLLVRVAGARHKPEELSTRLIGEPSSEEPMVADANGADRKRD